MWHTLAWAIFAGAYVGAVVFVSSGLQAPASSVLLVLAAGARLSAYIGATVGEIGFLTGFWMYGASDSRGSRTTPRRSRQSADLPVPARLTRGIRFDHVSFAYPGTDRLVLDDVNLMLPAGSVVAVVGENGAGKTTLVKLLAKMYEPRSGSIFIDDTPLARVRADQWRSRLAGAFQDFFRFEFRARQTVGVGDVPRLDDAPAVMTAVGRAGADEVRRQAQGRTGDTARADVAGRRGRVVRSVAEARARARLHAGRPAGARARRADRGARRGDRARAVRAVRGRGARGAARRAMPHGRITILVSHRFSTVRMADLIVVLDGSRVVEVGSHEELMAKRGPYSQLYSIQAAAYR